MQGLPRTRAARAGALLAALASIFFLSLLVRGEDSRAASAKPNVILFVTDDQTVRDMLALPRTQAHIGGGGATFERAYASFPLCCPSRITLQTGQHAHNHGVLGNTPPSGGYGKFNDKNALPVWLQAAGYRTVHIGKMPNGFGSISPPQAGFGPFPAGGEFYGFTGPSSAYTGFTLNENGVFTNYNQDEYQTDVYALKASRAIDDHARLYANAPLYMQLQFFAPHDPSTAALRHQGYFASQPVPTDKSYNEKDVRDKPPWVRRINRLGGGLRSKIATRYRGRLETLLAVDEAINQIMNTLASRGMLSNSYIIFTSDNGFMQGQHRLHQGKFVPYEPSIQVPLLIRGPGITPGTVSSEPVSNVDLTATIIEAAGAVPGLVQDGRSILPYARDTSLRTTRPILLETGPPGAIGEVATASGGRRKVRFSKYVKNLDLDGAAQIARAVTAPRYRAIRTDRYLLVKYGDGGRELYDMRRDPLQVNSVYEDPRYVQVRKFLIKKLAALQPCIGTGCNVEVGTPPKPRKRLKPSEREELKKKAGRPG
jgi:arylsulfatase A-like enzyme